MSGGGEGESGGQEIAAEPGKGPRLRADARRNLERLLEAAREVFVAQGPVAPLVEIARRGGVGIATLYRRFPDRQALQRAVALDVLDRVTRESRLALAEEPDAFGALARYMHRAIDLRVGAIMPVLMGNLALDDGALLRARDEAAEPVRAMIDAAHASGTLRPDVDFGDVGLLIGRLCQPLAVPFPPEVADRLAHRHLALLLDGMRADPGQADGALPGPVVTLGDLQALPGEGEEGNDE
jgi:AcrR family transcriptional regulator